MIRDSLRGFGTVSIFFHWVSAIVVLFLFGLGVYLTSYGYYSPDYLQYAHLHYALGILIFGFIIARLLWRLSSKTPLSLSSTVVAKLGVKLIKFSLYVLMFVVLVSGYLICTAEGQTISVFGWFKAPALIGLDTYGINLAGLTHKFVTWGLFFIVILHVGGALVHHFLIGDSTFIRMIKPLPRDKSE